jgi:hypothetical protein
VLSLALRYTDSLCKYVTNFVVVWHWNNKGSHGLLLSQSLQNSSVLSDMTNKILANFAKDWHKIGILQ